MKHTLPRLTTLLLTGLLLQTPLLAQDAKPGAAPAAKAGAKPFATVNGKAIPASRAESLLNEQKAQGTPDNEDLRKAIREELVRREVMTQEAVKKGMDKKPEVISQIELARQALLIRAYIQDHMKQHPIGDAAVKAEYETISKAMGDKEYKTRHILVEKEDQAKGIVARLQKGEKFEDLAKDSKDPGSKDRGGDLGWAAPAGYVKPFADALVKLEKGKFSAEPVKTDFGYHVILLEDVRPMKNPPLDEVKPQMLQRLQQQAIEKHILELRAKAKVE
jgi:peptidyl-prolyl cis-trans isomerase C